MYTMMQVCRELDMTYQTLKYYCNEGLVPNVKRDSNNRRVFDEKDVKWIKDLTCLKKCGMSIQEMKEYLDLCLQGEPTIVPRKEMLEKSSKHCLFLLKNWRRALLTSTGNKISMTKSSPASALMSATLSGQNSKKYVSILVSSG